MERKFISFVVAFFALQICLSFVKNIPQDSFLATNNVDIETQFCANVNLKNIPSNKAEADQIYQTMNKFRPNGKGLDQVILKKAKTQDYLMNLIPLFAPIFVMFLLTLIILIGCFLQCSLRLCCDCCKRDLIGNPYGKNSIFVCASLAIFMLLAILGTSIAGLVMTTGYTQSSSDLQCSAYQSIQNLLNGKNGSQWIGISNMNNQVEQLATNLNSFQTNFNNYNQPQIQTGNISQAINNTYTQQQADLIINPIYGATPVQVQPSLIQMLGPPNNQSTVTGSLTQEYNSQTLAINFLLNQFSASTTQIKKGFPQIISELQSGSAGLQDFTQSVQKVNNNTANDLQKFNSYNSKIQTGITVTFSVLLAFSVLGSLAIILMLLYKIPSLKFVIYSTWCFIAWFSILGFLVSGFLLAGTLITLDGCQVLYQSLNNQTAYIEYSSQYFDQTFQNDTLVCLYGDGDIPQHFGFNQIFDLLNSMQSSLDELDAYDAEINQTPKLVQLWRDTITFQEYNPSNSTSLTAYDQTYPIPPSTIQAPTAVYDCNEWSNYNAPDQKQSSLGNCKVLLDSVMFNYTQCLNSRQVPDSNPTFLSGSQVCVQVFAQDTQFINNRLNNVDFSSCTASANVRLNYQNSYIQLQSYSSQLNTLLNSLDQNLQTVQQKNIDVYTQFNASFNQISAFSSQISSILQPISNNQTGIAYNSNCTYYFWQIKQFRFLQQDFRTIDVAFCQSYLIEIYTIGVILLVISLFGFCGMICLFFSSSRLIFWSETHIEDIQAELKGQDRYNQNNSGRSNQSEYELSH